MTIAATLLALLLGLPLQVLPPDIVCNDAVDGRIHHPDGPGTAFFTPFGPASDDFATSVIALGTIAGHEHPALLTNQPLMNEQALWVLTVGPDGGYEYLHRIADGEGGFAGPLLPDQGFGSALARIDDLDGNGVEDLAVGATLDGGPAPFGGPGAVWILFLDESVQVIGQQKISSLGGPGSGLDTGDRFGASLAWLSDLDGDGVGELAVAAPWDDDGGTNHGAVWILFLRSDGTVSSQTKISELAGNFQGDIQDGDSFATRLAALPDLDGDGRRELAVGAPDDDGGAPGLQRYGAVWILFLRADGSVREHRRLSATEGGLQFAPGYQARFGRSVDWLEEPGWAHGGRLAVGTSGSFGGVSEHLWFLELDAGAQVLSKQSRFAGPTLSAVPTGDVDGDGLLDLAVGVQGPASCVDPSCVSAANWISILWGRDGSEHLPQLVADPNWLSALATLDDIDGNGAPDLASGSPQSGFSGAVRIRFLDEQGAVLDSQVISATEGGFGGLLTYGDEFGSAVASLSDLDGDGIGDLAVGAAGDDGQGGRNRGAAWILFLRPDGTVKASARIGDGAPALGTLLKDGDTFGRGLASADLDGDGRRELIVGAPLTNTGGSDAGILFVLALAPDGSALSARRIGDGHGGFSAPLAAQSFFGWAVAALGDLDGDGLQEIAASEHGSDDGGPLRGAVWILSLDATGTVVWQQKISQTSGRFGGQLQDQGRFGRALCGPGDVDGDGIPDLLAGAPSRGQTWLLLLDRNGAVRDERLLDADSHPFHGNNTDLDLFGTALALLDPAPDGHLPLLVGTGFAYWQLCLGPGAWTDLGQGLAGTGGLVPRLLAHGFQVPGEAVTFDLSRARRGSTAALVFGLSELGAPFAGGTLVPSPDVVHLGLPVDEHGELELVLRWPTTPALLEGAPVWAQGFVVDDGAPFGLSASNALLGERP